jgi:hypothetical protein
MAGWYVKRGGSVTGPIETDSLKGFVASGKLLPTDQIAKDVAGPWSTAGKTKLFATLPSPEPPPAEWVTVVTPERVAEATRKSSKGNLWIAGSVALIAVVTSVGAFALSKGEPAPAKVEAAVDEPLFKPEPIAANESDPIKEFSKPFEFKILSEEWSDGFDGKAVRVAAEVADDVAPNVTKADLESLVPSLMEKYGGAPFQVLFYTKTPLINAWGAINYTPEPMGKGAECQILDFALEFGPWYFPDKIDRDTKWHELVWITLPMANKIVNGATQYHWEVASRSANDVYFDSEERPFGAMKDTMRLSPQTWEICTYDGDVPRFVRLVESSLNHLDYDLSQDIVGKLNSVIGSQEYLHGDKTNWTWMIGRREVSYNHFDKNDIITIMQTAPE